MMMVCVCVSVYRNMQKLGLYGDTFMMLDDSHLSRVDQGGKKIKE